MPIDIHDQPGPLPGELETHPAAVAAFMEFYDVDILDYEDGTTPSVRVAPKVWIDVVSAARADDKLRAVRITSGAVWLHVVAVVDVGDDAVTMTATLDSAISRTVLDVCDL